MAVMAVAPDDATMERVCRKLARMDRPARRRLAKLWGVNPKRHAAGAWMAVLAYRIAMSAEGAQA